jgi:N-acetylglucosamine kinase-like BadF-type ATPase
MSKYDSPNHAQFYIGVDGGRTSCRAFPRLKLAGALFLARREGRAATEPRRQRKVRRYAH